jgi:hypothetical protein
MMSDLNINLQDASSNISNTSESGTLLPTSLLVNNPLTNGTDSISSALADAKATASSSLPTSINTLDTSPLGNMSSINSMLGTDVSSLPINLALPTFTTGAKDNLAAVDVYGVTSNSPINSIQAMPAIPSLAAAAALKGSQTSNSDLSSIIDNIAKKAASLNTVNPVNRLDSTFVSATRALPPGCANNLLSEISKILSKLTGARISANGILGMLNKLHIPCVTGMSGLINSIGNVAGSFSIKDPSASIASLSGVVNAASKLGIPNTFSSVLNGTTDTSIINGVVSNSLPTIIATSDLGSFKSMSQMASPGSLLMNNPNVIKDFSSSFKLPEGSTANDSNRNYTDLMTSFNSANPNWDTCTRETETGSDTITNLSSIVGASPDFNQTISNGITLTGDVSKQDLLLAPAFPVTSVSEELATNFPSTATVSTYSNVIDPITLYSQTNSNVVATQSI